MPGPEPTPGSSGPPNVELLDPGFEELRHATFGLFGARRRSRFLQDLDWPLAPVHYRLLRIVEASEPVRPTVTDLADALLTDKARASRLVDELVHAGLVTRVVGPLDRRRREIELSAAAREALARARRLRLDHLRLALADWDPADVETLAALLARGNASLRDLP